MLVRQRGGIDLKSGLVFPVGQTDPLQTKFVIAVEWVGNEPAAQQVGLNHAGNLRGVPLFDVGTVSIGHGSKLPARVQVARGGFGGCER